MNDRADEAPGDDDCFTGFRIVGPDGINLVPGCTLRAAIEEANVNGQSDTITFLSGLSGEIDLEDTAGRGSFLIHNDPPAEDLTINGPGAKVLAINGNDQTRAFEIASGANAAIERLTITNGKAHYGGGILNRGMLSVTSSVLSDNTADRASSSTGDDYNGGGIYNDEGGTLSVTNSTLSGGFAYEGGGIYNNGTLTLTNTTLSGNAAYDDGGGIFSDHCTGCPVSVTNSTLSGNIAPTRAAVSTLTMSHCATL